MVLHTAIPFTNQGQRMSASSHYEPRTGEINRINGFTLIELLVVVAIMGVLLALLIPAIQAARESARRSHCLNNIKQISYALQNHESQHGVFPAGGILRETEWDEGVSWRVLILPYLERQPMYELISVRPHGGAENWTPKFERLSEFICPSASAFARVGEPSHYAGIAGAYRGNEFVKGDDDDCGDVFTNGTLYPDSHTRIAQISDGTSHTLLLGEQNYVISNWMTGAIWFESGSVHGICMDATKNLKDPINAEGYYVWDFTVPKNMRILLQNNLVFGSEHPSGAHFSFADGSARFMDEGLDKTILQDLATKANEEPDRWQP